MLGRDLMSWQTPFSALHTLRREMDELFSRASGDWGRAGAQWAPMSAGYAPQVESYTEGTTLHIKVDLPGIDPKDVEVTVEGNQLTLKGERKAAHEAQEGAYREVRYGSFVRTFLIPAGVKAEDVQATYRHGVLELAIPLPASMLPKKVQVEIEGQGAERKQIAA